MGHKPAQDAWQHAALEGMIHGECTIFAHKPRQEGDLTLESKPHLDTLSHRILTLLQADGRLSHAELGRRVGLSPTAVTERVRALEADGVIQGYGAVVDPCRVGLPIVALVTLTAEGERCRKLPDAVAAHPEVLSCRRLTGVTSALLEVAVPSVAALEALVDRLGAYGKTSTTLVLSTAFDRRPLPLGGSVSR